MTETLNILLLEDRPADAEMVAHALRAEGLSVNLTRVWTAEDFAASLRGDPPDLILADYSLPSYDGFSALTLAQRERPDVPFIFVSGTLGEEKAVEALHHGATDYVLKDRLGRLGPAVRRALGAATDRRQREQAVRQLRESEERFRSIFDEVADGLALVEPASLELVVANAAMRQMLGRAQGGATHPGGFTIPGSENRPEVGCALQRAMAGEATALHDLSVTGQDGTVSVLDVQLAPVTISDRALLMACFRDVTEKRALRASVAQSDRLSSMGLLAAGVAHEIKNPLTYVLYNLESLAKQLPVLAADPAQLEPHARCVREALAGALRIRDVLRGLNTLSRAESKASASVDLNRAVECAASMARNEIRYRAEIVMELGELPMLWASEGKLSQVVLNLLINAAHAIEEGHPEANRVTVRTWASDGWVCAEVIDTGTGIRPEHLPHIFEPFFTTKPAGLGSGLGLSICRDILGEFGGDIHVESEVGRGTRFVLRVPVTGEPSAGRPVASILEPERVRGRRGRILVVDDEDLICAMLERILGDDHEVVTAESGEAACAMLERDQTFDLVLCDLMMPRMSGIDVHQWLSTRYPALAARLVFLTGGAFTPKVVDYLNRVGNPKIDKPVEVEELTRLVARYMASHVRR